MNHLKDIARRIFIDPDPAYFFGALLGLLATVLVLIAVTGSGASVSLAHSKQCTEAAPTVWRCATVDAVCFVTERGGLSCIDRSPR